jgi:hypothetical protein
MLRTNMTFLYGNSALLFFELLDPVYGHFHGLMLTLAFSLGFSLFGIIGSIVERTIHRIYKINGDDHRIFVEDLSHYKV